MDRCTRKDAEAQFSRLITVMGGRVAKDYKDVGAYRLDWNSTYGGGNIERIVSDTGGVSQPFGHTRKGAREFCEMCRFAIYTLTELRTNIKCGGIYA